MMPNRITSESLTMRLESVEGDAQGGSSAHAMPRAIEAGRQFRRTDKLFVPQSNYRIGAHGTASRDIASSQGNAE
jgi:hypothetical protein